MKAQNLAFILGKLFGNYFLVYPVLYFVYNYFVGEIGFSQFQIPGFWVGMAGFFLANIAVSFLKGIFK